MELCEMIKGQRAFHRLSDQQKAVMITYAAMRPQDRFRKIQNLVSSFISNFLLNFASLILTFTNYYYKIKV